MNFVVWHETKLATTLMGLREDLITTAEKLKKFNSSLSLSSSCELFTRFVTRTSLDIPVSFASSFFFSTWSFITYSHTGLWTMQSSIDRKRRSLHSEDRYQQVSISYIYLFSFDCLCMKSINNELKQTNNSRAWSPVHHRWSQSVDSWILSLCL